MPIDAGGYFTRLYDFEQDRDAGIRILASRVDGELDNIADALNTPKPSTSITYEGEELASVFDRIFVQLDEPVRAEDVAYGTTTVAAALDSLRADVSTINNKIDKPPVSEGYWSGGATIKSEGAWKPTVSIFSEGAWRQ